MILIVLIKAPKLLQEYAEREREGEGENFSSGKT
jgi:hypothetical protein